MFDVVSVFKNLWKTLGVLRGWKGLPCEHSSPGDLLTTVHWTVVPQRTETLRWQGAGPFPTPQRG